MILALGLALSLLGSAYSYEGLLLGGYGATNFIQFVGTDHICMGENVSPDIPQVLPAANPTWTAEYVDDTVFLCGGQNLDQRRDCYKYNPGQDAKFTKAQPMTEDRRLPASLVYNDEMYILGGYNDAAGWRDTVEFKPKGQDSFQALPDWKMDVAAYSQCAVAHDDKIYVMGGSIYCFLCNSDINNTQILDVSTGTWSKGEDLPRSRSAAACAVYELDGEMGILLAGGCDESCHEHLDDTLFFPFSTQKWETLDAKLHEPRMGTRMVIINDKPTLIGGYNTDLLESVEEFDGTSWTKRGDLQFGSYNYGMPSTLHGQNEEICNLEAITMECRLHFMDKTRRFAIWKL